MLYHASGTNAVRRGNLLERYFRDINAAMMHAAGLPANFEQGGRVAMELPPGARGGRGELIGGGADGDGGCLLSD